MAVIKKKVNTGKFRKPYYELSDSVGEFKTVSMTTKDVKLKDLAKKLYDIKEKIYKHLESNYIWD